ncbi:DNA (cytosine-5-)-methyltransferase [Pricia sp. S334]|uniref:Cytosine-specific methyltransferase n=1 Tax=Pricia mediterranea TaxID=3076079 RepID=A0ABU3L3F6_9FLAO|nr:DNA (cytosine-5-)-methyltransferase [Pricia sp. S334]MDT7828280.1 DNA (cytosine-5-)-methyltransferase [Pricia sp. S334]
MKEKLKVAELFAGVGGFRLGLEKSGYEVVWSNQWEPSTKMQHASKVYVARFGAENHSSEDIATVPTDSIPDHDVLVGGFPCQDYSVATTLNSSKGLKGKKGVLWWSIHRILQEKKNRPKYLILENVDRLLKSPAKQRGRDFAIMLQSLNQLGYAVEWRVINAAEYGMPQRRRRVFILGYHRSTDIYEKMSRSDGPDWLIQTGTMAKAFPVSESETVSNRLELNPDLLKISESFNMNGKRSPFLNSGLMLDGQVLTIKTEPSYDGPRTLLGDVLEEDVPPDFYIDPKDEEKWQYLKGSKTIERKSPQGFTYKYSEGGMVYPDSLDRPSRTIVTGEGGKSPSRFKHVIGTENGLRRLTPLELERLNTFPEDHTKMDGITDAKRAFFMGNALVVDIVERLGEYLYEEVNSPEYV